MPMNDRIAELENAIREIFQAHNGGRECWCQPFKDQEVIVHNSMDRREYIERLERRVADIEQNMALISMTLTKLVDLCEKKNA